jgi:hypothetical protein
MLLLGARLHKKPPHEISWNIFSPIVGQEVLLENNLILQRIWADPLGRG